MLQISKGSLMETYKSISIKDLKFQRECFLIYKKLSKYIIKQLPDKIISSNTYKKYFAEDIETQEILFCKIIQKKNVKIKKQIQNKLKFQNQSKKLSFAIFTIQEQVKEWQNLKHRNIIKNYEFIEDQLNILILSEFPQALTLEQLIKSGQKITYIKALQIIKQLVEGIIYMHSKSIVHLNISLRNIYCANNHLNLYKLGNPLINYVQFQQVYDKQFQAPQFITKESNDYKKADVFSLGIVLYFLLYSTMPWQNCKIQMKLFGKFYNKIDIMKQQLKFPKDISVPPSINYLIEDMLRFSEKQRIEVQQLRQQIIKVIHNICP